MSKGRNWTFIGLGIEVIAGVVVAINLLWAIPVATVGVAFMAYGTFPEQIQRIVSKLPFLAKASQQNARSEAAKQPLEKTTPWANRQPINHAYDWLYENGYCEDDENASEDIAHLLRQAAADEEITVWGAKAEPLWLEGQKPLLFKISSEYWLTAEIDPTRINRSVDALNDITEGAHVTLKDMSASGDVIIYWHLSIG